MEFRVLGPLEVRAAGREVVVAGEKQRRLLVALLLRAGEVVTAEQLIELSWPDRRPVDPRNALQSQIAQLRRNLGPDGHDLVRSRPPGYVLAVDEEQVDARRFERLVRRAREAARGGRPDEARSDLDEALALWRGEALEEVAHEPFATADAARLEEERLTATEDLRDLRLAVGEGPELVAELEEAALRHPLRERTRGQLMQALFRSGRQADALAVFHETRRVLDEELGIDPGPALTELHRKVLLQHDDLAAAEVPAADPAPVRRGVVPVPVSSFVGRSADLERVESLLAAARCVTLTGPGGVGKTRLAIEVARRADHATGAVARPPIAFVELASVGADGGVDDVAEALARATGVGEHAGGATGSRPPLDRVTDALHARRGLLVLDNCEHLLDEVAPIVRAVLERCPEVRVLATSRAPLGLTGEAVWSLPSLDLPEPSGLANVETLLQHDATRLFLERAREVDPTFAVVRDDEARAVAALCHRLDGIPLALELAAARVPMFRPSELLERLDDRFGLLASTDRTRAARQRTLRGVVDWSWQLCTSDEQRLLRRLGVLVGSGTLADIEAFTVDDDLPADRVLDVLSALVDRSLVVRERRARGVRFRLLETLRVYALERLDEAGERVAVEERLLSHLATVANTLVPRLRTATQLEAKTRLDELHDDLVAALASAARRGEVVAAGALAAELCWYVYLRGDRHLVARWAEAFEDAAPEHAAELTIWAAFVAFGLSDERPDLDRLTSALEVVRRHGTRRQVAVTELIVADLAAQLLGDRTAADRHLAAARSAATDAGEPVLVATTRLVGALPDVLAGDHAAAREQLTVALDGFRAAGDRWGQVQCLYALVGLDLAAGAVDVALRHAEQGLAAADELGLRELTAVLHAQRCEAALLVPDLPLATAELDAAERLAGEIGARFLHLQTAHARAGVALAEGDLDAAAESLRVVLDAELDDAFAPLVQAAEARAAAVAAARAETGIGTDGPDAAR